MNGVQVIKPQPHPCGGWQGTKESAVKHAIQGKWRRDLQTEGIAKTQTYGKSGWLPRKESRVSGRNEVARKVGPTRYGPCSLCQSPGLQDLAP